MAKLVIKGEAHDLLKVGERLYMPIEGAIAEQMGIESDSKVIVDLWFSEKHNQHYVAGYLKKNKQL